MLLVTSVSLDPFWNLAVEDHLLDLVSVQGPTLFLWQSHDSVVVGKNQNPWTECHQAYCRAHEIQIARRISGGGAVYHDPGNLNYAFFCARERYHQDEVYDALIGGLRTAGVDAVRMGKSSLATAQRKFSGNAFCYRRNSVLHHGTLLVDSNLEHLHHSLAPAPLEVDTHAVPSEPAPVVNLADLDPRWDLEHVGIAVTGGFEKVFGAVDTRMCSDDLHPDRMLQLHQQFFSPEWRLGRTPRFTVRLRPLQGWVRMEVTQGRISDVDPEQDEGVAWSQCLGAWFSAPDIAAAVAQADQIPALTDSLVALGI